MNAYWSCCPGDDGSCFRSEDWGGFRYLSCNMVYSPDGTGKVLEKWPCRVKDGRVYALVQSN